MTGLQTIEDVAEKYVPGTWRCKRCGFNLMQSTLNANTGEVGDADKPGEHCPNDGAPLWRVTWREFAEEQSDRGIEQLDRYLATKNDLDELVDICRRALARIGPQGYFPDIGAPLTRQMRTVVERNMGK